jgi:PAS domain S-box-containing protein
MPHRKRQKNEQPAASVRAQQADTTDVSRIDTAALWQAVCRVSGDYIAVVDRTGTIRFCNRVDDGWSPEQVMGRSMLDFTMPESTEQLYRVIEEVFATGREQTTETTVRRPDGSLNYFSLRLGPVLVDGRTAAILVCCENTLPLKTSEKSLQHERTLLRRLLKIQERERQLVSYEIHDGLAQYLAGAMMHLEACEHGLSGSGENRELREGLRLLRAAADEARRLISGLRPPALDELGIIDAVETLVADARAEVARVEFTHSLPARRLQPDVETTMFRIVQESLSNVRRHARAGSVSVRLEQHGENNVRIVVKDDGIGFDPVTVADDRFGIEGIRQRAWLLGGEPLITSSPGRGTTVTVTLPIDPKDHIQARRPSS